MSAARMREERVVENLRILVVEDSPDDAELILLQLQQEGFDIQARRVEDEANYLAALREGVDLILADWSLPRFSGLRALQIMREQRLDIPFIIISGSIGEESAVEALHQGAYDYLLKDRSARLGPAVRNALEQKQLREERRRMDVALRESEARFRRLAENAQDLIYRYTFHPRRGFEYVSPSATTITGYTPEEHYADPDLGFKIVHPEDRHLLEKVSQGEPEVFGAPLTLRWVRKDGTTIWTEQRNTPIYDEQGTLIAIEGIARDVTERKLFEEELQRRDRILQVVNEIAASFLKPLDWEAVLQSMLARLGRATNCSRALFFENRRREDGEMTARPVSGWTAQGSSPLSLMAQMTGRSYSEMGFGDWVERLSQGEVIVGKGDDLPPQMLGLEHPNPIPSFLTIPVFTGSQWVGFLGFKDENEDRIWSPSEVDALQAAAGILGAAMERRQAEQDLRKRQEELERFERLMVGRELRMAEMKARIQALEREVEALRQQLEGAGE
jgi:PAS domain S-box-containing protein